MSRFVALLGLFLALGLACAPRAARADFSACSSADDTDDQQQKIDLYTTCLKHGGLVATDVSGALNNRGVAYEELGKLDLAFQDFSWSVKYDPRWPMAWSNRAEIEAIWGRCQDAVADTATALRLVPKRWSFLEQQARYLATCPDPTVRDGAKAVALAEQAVKLKDQAGTRDTLAAAYAEAGRFDDALREQQKAMDMSGKDTSELSGMQYRLELYRKGSAFHYAARPPADAKPPG